ncbi:hypothetical protein [Bacillus sp. FJAT-45350]|uniref:hypothetical protein n=1 Tax=Bacillus sp. FJAT-45350 TaxID=2011014 RepID=UPI000BB69FC4|nr:hypothetical protein [Bacillus sp. FJAT-45350]
MKRLLVILIIFIIAYATYYDLSAGTLPKAVEENKQASDETPNENHDIQQTIPSEDVIVEPGYTVLSIVEHLHQGSVPVTIQQVIDDFKMLNPEIQNPDEIQIGKTYMFPLYE